MKKLIGSKSRFLTGIAFIFVILSIFNSCTKSTDYMNGMGSTTGSSTGAKGGPGPNEVWIQGMAFNPSTITVTAGTTITWTNKDALTHTVTSNSGLFDSGSINANGIYSNTFNTAGTFSYYCIFHPGMIASVVVK
jgi:plastocyanin